ncbi:MAG: flagellar export chaperone FliS [Clostridiales bacterium]|jgi:flagellar protein FliS|nr:flagellar export chaperone FliS [Clostridiales bacterium]
MYKKNPYDKYTNNNIYTAPKEELTLMLYEGALKFVNQAVIAIEANDFAKANDLLIRVQDIYRELQFTLNHKYEISKELNTLYTYIISRTREANMKKSLEILDEVRDLTRDFRDTWKEAMKLAKTNNQ